MANDECESRFVGKHSTSKRIATWSVPPTLKKIRHRLSEDRRCHPVGIGTVLVQRELDKSALQFKDNNP